MKTQRMTQIVAVSGMIVALCFATSFSQTDTSRGQRDLFQHLLRSGDHVLIAYSERGARLSIVTDNVFWEKTADMPLIAERGLVEAVYPDYVRIRLLTVKDVLAPEGKDVVVHLPFHGISAINTFVEM